MIDQAKLEELKQKHGDVYLLTKDEDQIAVRKPTRAEIMRIIDKGGDVRYADLQQLVTGCALFPEGPELASLLQERPGLVIPFSEGLTRIAGLSKGIETKKA